MAIEFPGIAPLLQVFNMPTSMHFYHDQLVFEVVSSDALHPGQPHQLEITGRSAAA